MAALFEMVFYFREVIHQEVLHDIALKMYRYLNSKEVTSIESRCVTEVIAICGVVNQDIVQHYVNALIEKQYSVDTCMLLLTNSGFIGLYALIQLATQELSGLSNLIMNYLSTTEGISK